MSAFSESESPVTSSMNCLRMYASKMGYNQCFDGYLLAICEMEEKGKDGVLYCLCKIDMPCPCPDSVGEIEINGQCQCGIFRR